MTFHSSKSVVMQIVKFTTNSNDNEDPDALLSRLNAAIDLRSWLALDVNKPEVTT